MIQRLQPQIRLLICGAGNDVMPLVTMAKMQDWHVTVVDSRAQYATQRRFPQADSVMVLALDDSDTLLKLSKNAAIALMSHSLSQDRARLGVLLEHANHYKYLGQLGPRYRTERLIEEISTRLTNPASLNLGIKKLHYPIGYKLGGDGPEALALGIMAQVNAVVHNQNLSTENSDTHLSNTNFTTLFSTHIDSIETTATSARAAINLS
ncbi:XdhC family protein [Psychrobacter sp. JCM 18903]|uniref:XdhC family protein n=1 Tax=Psychrobacter sp. JCM 18903 TaxID=1298610 RepID=UPI0004B91FDD|nr:XdhC family protein [Psychrobacter sp. JCM 18903]